MKVDTTTLLPRLVSMAVLPALLTVQVAVAGPPAGKTDDVARGGSSSLRQETPIDTEDGPEGRNPANPTGEQDTNGNPPSTSTADDVSVTLSAPPFVRFGDTFSIRLTVYNQQDTELVLDSTLIATGLEVKGGAAQQMRVPPNSEGEVNWQATTADESVAHLNVQVTRAEPETGLWRDAKPSGYQDANSTHEATLAVLPGGAQQLVEQRGRLWVREWLVSHLNYRATQVNSLVWISPSMLAMLLKDYTRWVETSYQNNAQAANLLLVTSALWDAFSQAGAQDILEAQSVRTDLSRAAEYLIAQQNPDGGWGWWPGDASRPLHTAQALDALFEAEAIGLMDMPATQETMGLDALRQYWESADDMDLQAYLLYVISQRRFDDKGLDTYELWWNRRKLSTPGLTYLGLALDNMNALPEHRKTDLLNALKRRASQTEHFVWWPTPNGLGEIPGGDRYGTAVALQAFLRWSPSEELVGRSLDWLLRTGSSPGEVIDCATTQVFVTLARAKRSQEPQSEGVVRVALEGIPVFEGTVNNLDLFKVHEISLQDLRPGSNWIEILLEWPGPLYFDWTLEYILSDGELDEARSAGGITLKRSYLSTETETPSSSYTIGQFVLTWLETSTEKHLYNVVIEDSLPAGFRPVTGSLKVADLEHSGLEPSAQGDVVRFYLPELPAGTHTFTYLQRAEIPGRFLAMPAIAYLIHNPARWGQSAGEQITVHQAD